MTRRLIGQIHLWIGLTLCLPLVLLGLTGSILVFEDELRAMFTRPPLAAIAGPTRPVAEIVAAARATAPGYTATSYVAPSPANRLATVRLVPERRDAATMEALRVAVDPVSLEAFSRQDDLLRQLFYLHSTLLMKNREGRQLIGWLGVAMLIMGISGLVNWWPRRGQVRAAIAVNPRSRGFPLHRELHGAAGIWGLVVFITVSFGGVYMAFPETVRTIVAAIFPARDLRAAANAVRVEPVKGARAIDIDAAIALARAGAPRAEPRFVLLPARPDRPYRVALAEPGSDRHAPNVTVLIDPWKARVIETFDPRQFSAGEIALAWQHALHAGEGLGWVWRILVFLSGFLPLLFAITGVSMWWRKRRTRSLAAVADPAFD